MEGSEEMTYWLDVYTPKAWEDSKKMKWTFSGFPESRELLTKNIHKNDVLICYMTGKSLWFGALKVCSDLFDCRTDIIWSEKLCPWRFHVKPIVLLEPEQAIPAKDLLNRLRMFDKLKNKQNWGGPLRTSPRRMYDEDAELVINELKKRFQLSEMNQVKS